MIIMQKMEG